MGNWKRHLRELSRIHPKKDGGPRERRKLSTEERNEVYKLLSEEKEVNQNKHGLHKTVR